MISVTATGKRPMTRQSSHVKIYLHCVLKPRVTVSKPPPFPGRVPTPILFALLSQLQKTLNLPAFLRIAGAEVEDETDGCHSNSERKRQID